MKKMKSYMKEILLVIGILILAFLASLLLQNLFREETLIPVVFALAVFLVAMLTQGYLCGIISSLVSVLAVNFAFTFPYFKFNFSIPENLISAIIMLMLTILTSTLTTKLRKQEKMRTESEKEKMRANLLRAVSHDLRTPLTTIYGSSSAMIENFDSITKEQKLQLLEGIREDTDWLMRMVENLLSVTRIDGNGVNLIKTPIVLEELVDTVLLKFRKRYPTYNVEVDIPEEFISIPMVPVLIEQVLVNLLENAVQHAKGMTELKLKVYILGNRAIFEIEDNGCGIPNERLSNIFTGFFEPKDAPVDYQKRSMGIGLSVCATIIKAHGGDISAKNRKSGGGVFRFSLELEGEEHE